MKLLLLPVLLMLGCHNGDKAGPSSGSAGAPTGGSDSPGPGSAAAGSPATAAPTTAPGSSGTPKVSELAKAVDDFDRWLAPIWKLSEKERFQALCGAVANLVEKADAIRAMPNDAADWQATADGLSMALAMARKCCLEQPKNLSPALQAGQDDTNDECIKPVHDDFANVVKLVPGTVLDSHSNDPLMKK